VFDRRIPRGAAASSSKTTVGSVVAPGRTIHVSSRCGAEPYRGPVEGAFD